MAGTRTWLWLVLIHLTSGSSSSVPRAKDTISLSTPEPSRKRNVQFEHPVYNVTIEENAVGRTIARVVGMNKMGLQVTPTVAKVKYKITSGDRTGFFRAGSRSVGDFCFVVLRTQTGVDEVLNRERQDHYELSVQAVVKYSDGNRVTCETKIHVTITDTNDLSPLFHPTSYDVEIGEDAPLYTTVLTVTASDADVGANGDVHYRLADASPQFAVQPASGAVVLMRRLQHRDKAEYRLVVVAIDRGATPRSSTAKLTIRVRRVNMHSPRIVMLRLPAIVEHGALGTVYAILYVHDGDVGEDGRIGHVQIVDGDPQRFFKISDSGNEYRIEVAKAIDREAHPEGFNLTVRAEDRGTPPRSSIKHVLVSMIDTNDQAPRFEHRSYGVSVSECVPVGTPLMFVRAADADSGQNAEVTYSIDDNRWFRLDSSTGLLSVGAPLDADNGSSVVQLKAVAEDRGNSGARRHGDAKVTVTVVDCNDNSPEFTNTQHQVAIQEGKAAGMSIGRVTATDADSGENGRITYSLINERASFRIDEFTGNISTRQVLDFESMPHEFVLRVRASDSGSPFRRETETTLTVRLTDINDNRPRFEQMNCSVQLPIDTDINTRLLVSSAIDFDAGDIVSYRISSGASNGCFKMAASSGELVTNCDMRGRRVGISNVIVVIATDGKHDSDPMSVNVTFSASGGQVEMTCRDSGVSAEFTQLLNAAKRSNAPRRLPTPAPPPANTHAPRFVTPTPDRISIKEDVSVGTQLVQFSATDSDDGYAGTLQYVIKSGNKDGAFRVDTDTGVLTVFSELDRERNEDYPLVIVVSDQGWPARSASVSLHISVQDVNDNSPRFESSHYSVSVAENVRVNTTLLRLLATDVDAGVNAEITFAITPDDDNFSVDPQSGVVIVRRPLDRERNANHRLVVTATDNCPRRPLSASATIEVEVTDINDNAPTFLPEAIVVRVREDMPIGGVIAMVTASDPDQGSSGVVRYQLQGNGADHFNIDRHTGAIRVATTLDYETRSLYNLTARAKDRGDPSLSTRGQVVIEVIDVDENLHAPVFADFVIKGEIAENSPIGSEVMRLEAYDDDVNNAAASPSDYEINYSVRDGSGMGLFTVDNEGVLRTRTLLDHETSSSYWLCIHAQDSALIPRSTHVHVYVRVLDSNDNVPQTLLPAYFPSVAEGSPAGTSIAHLVAVDRDEGENARATFTISSGNPQKFFTLDPDTGLLSTTNRLLDREKQEEHILEVTVEDHGEPPLSSTTRVVVSVTDVNDESPSFTSAIYRVELLERSATDTSFPVYRVVAGDRDRGRNSEIHYSVSADRASMGSSRFSIDSRTGVISTVKALVSGNTYDLKVVAHDNGEPSLSQMAHVFVTVVSRPAESRHPPVFDSPHQIASVMEKDHVGHMVQLLSAHDDDGNKLWYSITGGNINDTFAVEPETGQLILARSVDWETRSQYNLTISVTDGIHTASTWAGVTVLDNNEHSPQFSEQKYEVTIDENTPADASILTLRATDRDQQKRLFYTIHRSTDHATRGKFHINSEIGVLTTVGRLDHERMSRHELTVMVRDQGIPSRRSLARVVIHVRDRNDHAPEFLQDTYEASVGHAALSGTSLLQVTAVDRDSGRNARVKYSIVAGNILGTFAMDATLGVISLARDLDSDGPSTYELTVHAVDGGSPSLTGTAMVEVSVSVPTDAPPRFTDSAMTAEVEEERPVGTFVASVSAVAHSSVIYAIVNGNGTFLINPHSGTLATARELDYEKRRFYNVTVRATNMAAVSVTTSVAVYVVDVNDNAPVFDKEEYVGYIGEKAAPGSAVLAEGGLPVRPLVVAASDADSGSNALLRYDIVEPVASSVFRVDPTTGAISTGVMLDRETTAVYHFSVQVRDLGRPAQVAALNARVTVRIVDANDSPPKFSKDFYAAKLALPTYTGVAVVQVMASDLDVNPKLHYSLGHGDPKGHFSMDPVTGLIRVVEPLDLSGHYELEAIVTDGASRSLSLVRVDAEPLVSGGLRFTDKQHQASVKENVADERVLLVLSVSGHRMNEGLNFDIISHQAGAFSVGEGDNEPMFNIGRTSGVLTTAGKSFDREKTANYTLAVQVTDNRHPPRIARCLVVVTVTDDNDNAPVFIGQPYYVYVPVGAGKGKIIAKLHAVDADVGDNARVRYRLPKSMPLFRIRENSGELILRHQLTPSDQHVYQLQVEAFDAGSPSLRSEVIVVVTVTNQVAPVFSQSSYAVTIAESTPQHAAITYVEARSVDGIKKVVYSITAGNIYDEFGVDFNTDMNLQGPCSITVVDELDFETVQVYNLTVRATDMMTGSYAEVLLRVQLEDVNDNWPSFSTQLYTSAVSESVAVGTTVARVTATDRDSGVNARVHYRLVSSSDSDDNVSVDATTGAVVTRQRLDRERSPSLTLLVAATDGGIPSLSATATVHLMVVDVNDNAPEFDAAVYHADVCVHAERGQFVTVLGATDADGDELSYHIVAGDRRGTFTLDRRTGVVRLAPYRTPRLLTAYRLNISATDGVYATYATLRVHVRGANVHAPEFARASYEVDVAENMPADTPVANLSAVDHDTGRYGRLEYAIEGGDWSELFHINPHTGIVYTREPLDREEAGIYVLPVVARDGGGRAAYTTLRVNVADIADHTPEFSMEEYKANVYASAIIGATVLQVTASDADIGSNSELQYTIYDGETMHISDWFNMEDATGVLSVKRSLVGKENELFQFFVRASDRGVPPSRSDIPVEVYVMSNSATPPSFPRKSYAYFVSEDQPSGTQVACVRAVTNHSLDYCIVSKHGADSFAVSDVGCISVTGSLDRELVDKYDLHILASTHTSPPLVAYVSVSVQVMDVNDNSPRFEGGPYVGSVMENTPPGTRVIQMRASDRDAGVNGRVTYRLGSEANVFAVDAHTGWLTTLVSLDRETTPRYNVTVIATDGGEPRLKGTATVTVDVADDNDSPLVFTRDVYRGSVSEDATPGTVVLSVATMDADESDGTDVAYHITAGDPRLRFRMSDRGELQIARPVDREEIAHYRLQVTATDGLFVATAAIDVQILDANDNSPVCEQPLYQTVVAENIAIGSFITQVLASDADQKGSKNSRITYSLEGDPEGLFKIHKRKGVVSTMRPLDRETTPEFTLTAIATDGGGLSCRAAIYVSLSDVNDNAPEFSSLNFEVMIPEDAHVNTLLTRVTANDRDRGINRKVRYAMKSSLDHFKIDEVSGVISLTKELDREKQPQFNLTVYAYDQGTPKMTSTAYVLVQLLDINDNPPEFESALYVVSVSEATEVGTSLQRVFAASRDTGVNAQITYAMNAGNEHGCFAIHPSTGVISLAEPLDFETTRQYIMTVEAHDGGQPPLRNTAIVKVNVTDANDNAPEFAHAVYSAELSEAAQVHEIVVQVKATDRDSPSNAVLTYHVTSGDPRNQFEISADTGHIRVMAPLDRELTEHYKLMIEARDSGNPSLSGTTSVEIDILDTNDSPPKFSKLAYNAIVQEDRPVHHSLLQLEVTDADSSPNGAPFTFDIVAGDNDSTFGVTASGVLVLAGPLDLSVRDAYELVVRVRDNGVPPLSATTPVSVRVVEESAYPPVVTPLAVVVAAYDGDFAGGVIGRVRATDRDAYDTLTYSLSASATSDLFDIHPQDGTVHASRGLDAGDYRVSVSVSDGKFETSGVVSLRVVAITDDLAANAVVVRFAGLLPEDFIDHHRHRFIAALQFILAIRREDAHLLGVQPVADQRARRSTQQRQLDVLVAVRRSPDGATYRGNTLRRYLADASDQLARKTGAKVVRIFNDVCKKDACAEGRCETEFNFNEEDVIAIITARDSFVSPRYTVDTVCKCHPGYTGSRCDDKENVCEPNPCPAYRQICRPDGHEFTCSCPDGFTGDFCETNEQDRDINCIDMACRRDKPMTFSTYSYMSWQLTIPMVRRVSFTLHVKTVQQSARLMHSTGSVDYSILELENGVVQYRFDCGSGEGRTRVSKIQINDGFWHSVTVERRGRSAKVIIDGEFVATGSAPGTNDELNLDGDIFFGAEVTRLADGHEDITRGFVGCLRDIKVDGISLPVVGSNEVAAFINSKDVEFHCRGTYIPGVCSSGPCLNGGSCVPFNKHSFVCRCRGRFIGATCETDTDPCASNPCLHGGKCENMGSDYRCHCPGKLQGRRCETNFYCYPNPCKHGGRCTDGTRGPICACSGFTGTLCERDIDECANNPCQNGGTCTNLYGTFRCNCTTDIGGATCEKVLLTPITSTGGSFNLDELFGIAGVVGGILLIALIFVVAMRCRWQRRRRRHLRAARALDGTGESASYLYNCDELKARNRQAATLEPLLEGPSEGGDDDDYRRRLPTPPPPPVPTRPASYTPSAGGSMNTLDNGLDEIEAVPMLNEPIHIPEFLRNLDVNKPLTVSTQRPAPPPRCYDAPAARSASTPRNFREAVKKKTASDAPGVEAPTDGSRGCSLASLPISEEEDLQDYVWDTSDWQPDGATAAVPLRELPDIASDEDDDPAAALGYPEPDSEYVGDSEYLETENEDDVDDSYDVDFINSAQFQEMLARQGDLVYEVNDDADNDSEPRINYNLHPDDYLPPYQLDGSSLHDSDVENAAAGGISDYWVADSDDDAADESVYVGGLGSDCGGLADESDFGGGGMTSDYGDLPSDFGAVTSDIDGAVSDYGDTADSDYGAMYARNAANTLGTSLGGYASTNASAIDMSCLCEIDDSEMNSDDGHTPLDRDDERHALSDRDDEEDVQQPLLLDNRRRDADVRSHESNSASPTHTQV